MSGRSTSAWLFATAAFLASFRARADDSLGWAHVPSINVVAWGEPSVRRREEDTSRVRLDHGEMAIVPVSPGEQLRVKGNEVEAIGYGSGGAKTPDAILWLPNRPEKVQIPLVASPEFLVVRATGVVHIERAAEALEPMRWHRFDLDLVEYLEHGGVFPVSPGNAADPLVHRLRALESIVGRGDPALVMLEWLEGSQRVRPLVSPFFARVTPSLRGGKPLELPWKASGSEWLRTATALIIEADADVAAITIAASRKGPTRVRIFEGSVLSREVEWTSPREYRKAADWSTPEAMRVLLRGGHARVEVVTGEVVASVTTYRARTELLDGARRRLRTAWREDGIRTAFGRAYREVLSTNEEAANGARGLVERVLGQHLEAASPIARRLAERDLELEVSGRGRAPRTRLAPLSTWSAEDTFVVRAANAKSSGASMSDLTDALSFAEAHPETRAMLRPLRAFFSATRWARIDGPEGARVRVEEFAVESPDTSDGRCTSEGAAGERWTKVDDAPIDLEPTAPPGYRSRVIVRPRADREGAEGTVDVDGVPIFVHGFTGMGSVVLLNSGPHHFVPRTPGLSLLVRSRLSHPVACSSLVELAKWSRISGRATVDYAPESSRSLLRISARPSHGHGTANITTSTNKYETWFLENATGSVVLPIAAGEHTLRIESSMPMETRFWVRRAAEETVPLDTLSFPTDPTGTNSILSVESLLGDVRRLSKQIAAGTYNERAVARKERAFALQALGFQSLARLDTPPASLPLDSDEEVPFVPGSSEGRAVEPAGLLARLSPLARGLPKDELRGLREKMEARAFCEVVDQYRGRTLSGAGALLVGIAAEKGREYEVAAERLKAVGENDPQGIALAHAAMLLARRAGETKDRTLAQKAFTLAAVAERKGDPAGAVRAVLAPFVRWETPARLQGGAGFREIVRTPADPAPLRARVLSAWIDAPTDAPVFRAGERMDVRVRAIGTRATIEGRCASTERVEEICHLHFFVDGAPAACRQGSGANLCVLELERGPHRLSAELPPGASGLGWARASVDEHPVEMRVTSSFLEIRSDEAATTDVLGPTVLELSSLDATAGALRLRIEREGGAATEEIVSLSDRGKAIGLKVAASDLPPLAIPIADGRHRITLSVDRGSAFARVRVADVVSAPPNIVDDAVIDARVPEDQATRPTPLVRVQDDSEPNPFSVSATVSGQGSTRTTAGNEDLTSASWIAAPFVETNAHLRRAFGSRSWVELGAITRLREGPTSFGGDAKFDLLPGVWFPGIYLGGTMMAQPTDGTVGRGGHLVGELYRVFGLSSTFNLTGVVGGAAFLTDRALRGASNADVDVYATYPANVPYWAEGSLRLDWRPLVDTLGRLRTDVRTTDRLTELDRVDLRVEVDALPGRGGFPWLGATLLSSARPATDHRPTGFVRHMAAVRATVWDWVATGHRLSLSATARFFFDAPSSATTALGLTGILGVSYDWTERRGLADFPRRLVPFRERMEEGSGRLRRTSDVEAGDAP